MLGEFREGNWGYSGKAGRKPNKSQGTVKDSIGWAVTGGPAGSYAGQGVGPERAG
jgi:hypothetical protein